MFPALKSKILPDYVPMMAGEGGYAMRFNALSLFILNTNLEGLCQIQAKYSANLEFI